MEERQIKMFGTTTETLKASFEDSRNKKMFLMSLLSDSQDAMEFGNEEKANQLINSVKYLIDNNF